MWGIELWSGSPLGAFKRLARPLLSPGGLMIKGVKRADIKGTEFAASASVIISPVTNYEFVAQLDGFEMILEQTKIVLLLGDTYTIIGTFLCLDDTLA